VWACFPSKHARESPEKGIFSRHKKQRIYERRSETIATILTLFASLILVSSHLCYSSSLSPGELTVTKIKDSFAIFKNLVLEVRSTGGVGGSCTNEVIQKDLNEETTQLLQQIKDLKSCLLQRDNEIAILVNMVKKERANPTQSNEQLRMFEQQKTVKELSSKDSDSEVTFPSIQSSKRNDGRVKASGPPILSDAEREAIRSEKIIKKHLYGVAPPEDKSVFDDMAGSIPYFDSPSLSSSLVCFEYFRSKCDLRDAIDENKAILKEKMKEAQLHGERANKSRNAITYLKKNIETIRRER
jgi:hypothetical protein